MLRDERGVTKLEWIGIVAAVFSVAVFIPAFRGTMGDIYERFIWGNTFWRGVWITLVAFGAFMGTVFVVLYTNLGARLGFLIAGSALTGWGVIQGFLFTITVPRGPRPAAFEGLNAFQLRIMSLALMLGSAILFAMFLVALNRLEAADQGGDEGPAE